MSDCSINRQIYYGDSIEDDAEQLCSLFASFMNAHVVEIFNKDRNTWSKDEGILLNSQLSFISTNIEINIEPLNCPPAPVPALLRQLWPHILLNKHHYIILIKQDFILMKC